MRKIKLSWNPSYCIPLKWMDIVTSACTNWTLRQAYFVWHNAENHSCKVLCSTKREGHLSISAQLRHSSTLMLNQPPQCTTLLIRSRDETQCRKVLEEETAINGSSTGAQVYCRFRSRLPWCPWATLQLGLGPREPTLSAEVQVLGSMWLERK